MKYFYYPGCSLEGTAIEYNRSTQAVMRELEVELLDVEDWTCCGASAAEASSHLLSMVLPARNLALAEQTGVKADFLIPCSACFLNLERVNEEVRADGNLLRKINEVLEVDGLSYQATLKARHLLDILANDIGTEKMERAVSRPLTQLRVAPYYGCQSLRPYGSFDDPEQPRSMEPLIGALGAEVHSWTMGPRCCGAGLMTTKQEVALDLVGAILKAARGSDCIVTVCPMCQMNLEYYQRKASKIFGENLQISVLYFPQLMGIAFGLSAEELRLNLNGAFTHSLRDKLGI